MGVTSGVAGLGGRHFPVSDRGFLLDLFLDDHHRLLHIARVFVFICLGGSSGDGLARPVLLWRCLCMVGWVEPGPGGRFPQPWLTQ